MKGQLDFTTESRIFPPEELPLLTAQLRLPRWNGTDGTRFNRFYTAYGRAFFSYCQLVLLPQAQSALSLARETGAPVPEWRIQLDTCITLQRKNLVSLYTDTVERCGSRPLPLRRSETWDLTDGSLLALKSLFPGKYSWRHQIFLSVSRQIRQQQAQGLSRYHPDWQRRLRTAFSAERFYLTEQGLCLFYQMYAIAPAAEGIPVFTIPWDEATGPHLPQ